MSNNRGPPFSKHPPRNRPNLPAPPAPPPLFNPSMPGMFSASTFSQFPPPSFPFPSLQQPFRGPSHPGGPNIMYVPVPVPVPMPNQQYSETSAETKETSSRSKEKRKEKHSSKHREKGKEKKRKRPPSREHHKSKARTLGELVDETSEMAEKRRRREKKREREKGGDAEEEEPEGNSIGNEETQEPSTSTSNETAGPTDETNDEMLMTLSAADLEEPIVFDECDFDPLSMKIRRHTAGPVPVQPEKYYVQEEGCVLSTPAGRSVTESFESRVLNVMRKAREKQVTVPRPPTPPFHHKCKCGHDDETSSSESSSDDENDANGDVMKMSDKQRNIEIQRREVERKQNHPSALNPDICFNEPGLSNDGPVCRCSVRSRGEGIRHNIFPGEEEIDECEPNSNNADRLYHYMLRVGPAINVGGLRKSTIRVDNRIFELEGFSVFFHQPLPKVFPAMPASRWTTEFDFEFVEEPVPECFTVGELELFHQYLFLDLLELFDAPRHPHGVSSGCPIYHVMPRYVSVMDGVPHMLSMARVLEHICSNFRPLLSPKEAKEKAKCDDEEWRRFNSREKHQLVTWPEKKPSTIRVDSFMRSPAGQAPLIVVNTIKPSCYLNMNTPEQQRLTKKLSKMRSLLMGGKRSLTEKEQEEMDQLQRQLDGLKAQSNSMRNTTVVLSSAPFYRTGLCPDIVPHVLIVLLSCQHARMHWSLGLLEKRIGHSFRNRSLLELSLTHPSFKNNYGTTADHAKNVMMNCAYKRRYNTSDERRDKKRGINRLMEIMSQSGQAKSALSPIAHNERLEYLGDAVVEMIVSNRLFYMLPHHNEGGLATYRSSLVQNRNLATLAKNLGMHHWLLFAHGADLCHEADFRHALANSFEAIMAAVYLDSDINECDRIFSDAMFGDDSELRDKWDNVNEHELKLEYPEGDRHLIEQVPALKKLTEFEELIGVKFKNIRILAKAFTRRNVPMNEITRGHNQRMEWLGDTVLQLIVSDYLYKHFPLHHEGHLSLLRTCIVSNKTQSLICNELGMPEYLIRGSNRTDCILRVKDRADLVEAFMGALYVDRGWEYCKTFVRVCFLPRLKLFITAQKWNDPKSQLQQACLTLRSVDASEPEIPVYKVLFKDGPTNSRLYRVAVYFREKRLAVGDGHNVHIAEMEAARKALMECQQLFPHLDINRKVPPPPPTVPRSSIPSLLSLSLPQPFAPFPAPFMASPGAPGLPAPIFPMAPFGAPAPLPPPPPPPEEEREKVERGKRKHRN